MKLQIDWRIRRLTGGKAGSWSHWGEIDEHHAKTFVEACNEQDRLMEYRLSPKAQFEKMRQEVGKL